MRVTEGWRGRGLLAITLALLGTWAVAQSQHRLPQPDEVSRFVQMGLDDLDIPGAAVAMIEDGQITLARGFGRLDRTGAPVTAQSPFQVASVSKSFTALVILQLADEGRLVIDDPVISYLPYFRTADPGHGAAVTLRHLMNHTSGLATVDGNRLHAVAHDDPNASESAVRALGDARPVAAPGAQFHYSNANYIVLGDVIEKVEGRPYEEVLEARVFSRLGMANAYASRPPRQTAESAMGHAQWFGFASQNHHRTDRAMLAAGGVVASAEDLAKYLLALSEGDARIVPSMLSRSWNDRTFTGYAFGWHHLIVDGRRVILHDGLNPGFRARVMVLPDERKAAVLVMNVSGVLDGNLPISAGHHALGLPPVPARPSTAITLTLWGSLAMTLCLALGCFAALRKAFRLRHTAWNYPESLRWLLMIGPSAIFTGGAWALLFLVPRSIGLDFSGTQVFYPDLAAMLLATAGIALVWAIVLPVLLRMRPAS